VGRRGDRWLLPVGLMAAGVGLWAYASAWLTPTVEPATPEAVDSAQPLVWVRDQRELTIGLMVAALVLARAGRGPVVLPAIIAFAALSATDYAVDATGLSGWPAAGAMVATAAAILYAATRTGLTSGAAVADVPGNAGAGVPVAAGHPRVAPAPGAASRRAVAVVAVGAALVAPWLMIDVADSAGGDPVPAGLLPTGAVAIALLWCAAAALASTLRPAPPGPGARIAYTVVPVAVVAGFGAWPAARVWLLALPAVLVVLVVAVARGWRSLRPARWVVLGLGGLVGLVPYACLSVLVAIWCSGTALRAYPTDDLAFLPGAVPVSLAVGALLARVAVPGPLGAPGVTTPAEPMWPPGRAVPGRWEPDAPPGRWARRAPVARGQADS
jgi:hypothetical protein